MTEGGDERRFAWHPAHAGQTVGQVRQALERDITADQRSYDLTLNAADEREGDALERILPLEKRWGTFDMGWAEAVPAELAGKVVEFEWARETRRELFPFADYRAAAAPPPAAGGDAPWWAFWKR
ncbi:MAG: hypothetical protein H0U40_10720 [Chloroflexia bacterium]|jgi:hypothetical protein|nr:hypothetical protein [Chloroflexia bacterium]